LLSIPQKDIQAGLKLIKKGFFKKFGYPKEIGWVWDSEVLCEANKRKMKILEIPIKYTFRKDALKVQNAAPSMLLGLFRVWFNKRILKK
jgi:hypothetical protein